MRNFFRLQLKGVSQEPSTRVGLGISIISIFILVSYFWSDLRPMINLNNELWEYPTILPLIKPVGDDFREGFFYPAKIVLQGKDPYVDYDFNYPPFAAVFSIPFRLFQVDQAYLVQVGLLFVLNAATLWLSLKLVSAVFIHGDTQNRNPVKWIPYALFPLLAWMQFTSYGFYFSIERGNSDIYAQFFVVLALWFLVTKPKSPWWPVVFVSIATHLKFYPAIIFVLIFWKFGWKSLLPILVTNLALLLSLGPVRAWEFIRQIIKVMQNPFVFAGNHSAVSFGNMVNGYLQGRIGITLPVILFYLLPVLIWAIGTVILWRRKYSLQNALLFFILSVPLMDVIPTTSYDYKLVILIAPLAIALYFLLQDISQRGRLVELAKISGLMFLMLFINRSYTMLPVLLKNKYPFILVMQLIFLWLILVTPQPKPVPSEMQDSKASIPELRPVA